MFEELGKAAAAEITRIAVEKIDKINVERLMMCHASGVSVDQTHEQSYLFVMGTIIAIIRPLLVVGDKHSSDIEQAFNNYLKSVKGGLEDLLSEENPARRIVDASNGHGE